MNATILMLIIGGLFLTIIVLATIFSRSESRSDAAEKKERRTEAYILTIKGHHRYEMKDNTPITYEGAKMLSALRKHGKLTAGELADTCSHMYQPAVRREIDDLISKGFVTRDDMLMTITTVGSKRKW